MAEVKLQPLIKEFDQLNAIYNVAPGFDPFALYRDMRRDHPVLRGDFLSRYGLPSQANYSGTRTVVTLFRHADVMRVLSDTESFSSGLNNDGFGTFWGEDMPLSTDGDVHRRLRTLVNPSFFGTALLAEWRRSFIDPTIRSEYLEPLAGNGRCELIRDFTLPYPVRVMYEILGFPNDPEEVTRFAKWTFRVFAGLSPTASAEVLADARDCAIKLYDNVLDVVRRRRATGADGNDLISRLITAEHEGGRLGDREIASLVRSLLPAASETTSRSTANMVVLLLDRPELMARAKADRGLIRRIVQETLRYESVAAFIARACEVDAVFNGETVQAGTALLLATACADRDEAVWENGDVFDPDRKFRPNLGFGGGAHTCLGMQIAKIEMEVALNAMFDLMPGLRADADQPRPVIKGLMLRGPDAVHLEWDTV